MKIKLVVLIGLSACFANVLLAVEKVKSKHVEYISVTSLEKKNNTRVKKEVSQEKTPSKISIEKKSFLKKNVITPKKASEKSEHRPSSIEQKDRVPSIKSELENMMKITSSKRDDFSKKSTAFDNPFERKTSSKHNASSHLAIPSKNVLLNQDTLGPKFAGSETNSGRNGKSLTASNISQF